MRQKSNQVIHTNTAVAVNVTAKTRYFRSFCRQNNGFEYCTVSHGYHDVACLGYGDGVAGNGCGICGEYGDCNIFGDIFFCTVVEGCGCSEGSGFAEFKLGHISRNFDCGCNKCGNFDFNCSGEFTVDSGYNSLACLFSSEYVAADSAVGIDRVGSFDILFGAIGVDSLSGQGCGFAYEQICIIYRNFDCGDGCRNFGIDDFLLFFILLYCDNAK